MNKKAFYVSPEEIVKLSDELVHVSELQFARDVYEKYKQTYPDTHFCFALAAVFAAGRVQGVREERARKGAIKQDGG